MSFEEMQAGELAWWKAFLKQPDAIPRLFALYGYRYLPFFFREFDRLGEVVDFGSGPVSAAFVGQGLRSLSCVDPLLDSYHTAGLVWQPQRIAVYETAPPAAYDTALLLNVLDHTDRGALVLEAAAAALKPTGVALVWVHVDNPGDELHVPVTAALVLGWIAGSGLHIARLEIRQDYGPAAFMAVAKP